MVDKITFETLWNLKIERNWYKYEIYATTKKDFKMAIWKGTHEENRENNFYCHMCPAGTKVRIWMVSRFGDVGITDNLINPRGYDCRGVDVDTELENIEIIKIKE